MQRGQGGDGTSMDPFEPHLVQAKVKAVRMGPKVGSWKVHLGHGILGMGLHRKGGFGDEVVQ